MIIPNGSHISVFSSEHGVWHHAIYWASPFGPHVIDNTKSKGVQVRRYEEFVGRSTPKIERVPSAPEYGNIVVQRAYSQVGKPYHLFAHNCEHFANWAFDGVPRSGQLQLFLLTAAVVTGLLMGG